MHELSIAVSIVDGVLEEAERHGSALVETVVLRVGKRSGIDRSALEFSYQVASQDTPLRDSRLLIEEVDIVFWCDLCRAERSAQGASPLRCGTCGAFCERVIHGDELEIIRLELAA